MREIGVIGLSLTLSFAGWLAAEQTAPRASTATPQTLLQQLSELFEPLNISVAPSAAGFSETMGTREFRVRWTAGTAVFPANAPQPGPPPDGSFLLFQERKYSDPPPRRRSLDLAAERLFIAAVDRSNRLRAWTTIIDPRIVRAEGPGPAGTLAGQTLHLQETEFLASLPDDPEIFEVRFYEPRSNGQARRLALLGSVFPNR